MQKLKKNQGLLHKKLVIDNQWKVLSKAENNVQEKSKKQAQNAKNKLINRSSSGKLRIDCSGALKTQLNDSKNAEKQAKRKNRISAFNQNPSNFYAQTSNNKQPSYKRRSISQQLHKVCLNAQSPNGPQEKQVFGLVNQIFSTLVENYVFQGKAGSISVKQEKLLCIFTYFFNSLVGDQDISQANYSYLHLLKPTMKKMKKCFDKVILTNKQQRLTLVSNVMKIKHFPAYTQGQLKSFSCQIEEALIEKQRIDEQLDQRKKYVRKLEEDFKQKQLEFKICLRQIYQRKQQLIIVQNRVLQKQRQIQQQQSFFQQNKAKVENLINFVEKQEQKKILHWVSEAYKQIQSEIYDYASYLQCNSMASSLTWQPKPFRAVEKWVYQQMERVNLFVMSKAESFEDKCARMKEFITSTTRKFRTKDEQMMKITDYKTECIKKYIKMMQKWLQNWELKQEYLVSLRQQFVVLAQNIHRIIRDQLQGKENTDKYIRKCNFLGELKLNWQKIVLNYSYGNSFY